MYDYVPYYIIVLYYLTCNSIVQRSLYTYDYILYYVRLSPAKPHFPILFPILVQSDRFIFFRK